MSKLHEIAAQRRADVAVAKTKVPKEELLRHIQLKQQELGGPPLNLAERLKEPSPIEGAKMHVAAEFKRASPSKGAMAAEDLSIEAQVTTYVQAGSSVVSVLTEPKWFKGSLEDMELAKRMILQLNPTKPRPLVLRKDFLIDEYQLLEARAYGADTVLLIVAILSDEELSFLIGKSRELGMEPLVEAANEAETIRALQAGAKVLGINNRDLTTFKVDLTTTNRCAALVQPSSGVSLLALSGLKGREDVVPYEKFSVIKGVLVGEHLMRCDNPVREIHALVSSSSSLHRHDDMDSVKIKPLVKICGIVRPEDALVACKAKADFIGIIFAEKSPRTVLAEDAKKIVQVVRDFRESKSSIVIEPPAKPVVVAAAAKRVKLSDWFMNGADCLRKACTRGPLIVGVFMNQPIEYVNEMVETVGLDLVQLHGSESWDCCSDCIVPVIKVVHIPVKPNLTDDDLVSSVANGEGHALAVLLDTTIKGGAEGGTGVSFDWDVASRYKSLGVPVFVAGGLTPENVAQAVSKASYPLAVDCSSGVQKAPREKDVTLIQAFIERAKDI